MYSIVRSMKKKCRFSLFNILYYNFISLEYTKTEDSQSMQCVYCVIVFSAHRVIYIQVYSLPNARAARMFNIKMIQRINIM